MVHSFRFSSGSAGYCPPCSAPRRGAALVSLALLGGICLSFQPDSRAAGTQDGAAATRAATSPADSSDLPTAYAAEPGLRDVVEAFQTDYQSLQRFYPLSGSAGRAARFRRFLDGWLAELEKMDYAALTQPARIDFLLLRSHVRHERSALDHEAAKLAEIRTRVPFAEALIALQEARAAMKPADARQAAATLAATNKQVQDLHRRVEAAVNERQRRGGGPQNRESTQPSTTPSTAPAATPATAPVAGAILLPPSTQAGDTAAGGPQGEVAIDATKALRAAQHVATLQRALREWNDHSAQFDPEFAWWAGDPYAKLDKSLEEYAKLLRERVAGARGEDDDPLVGDPIGRQALLDDLTAEMIDYTPEQLVAIARRELAWCHEQRLIAAREMGLGEDWRAAVEKVKNQHVPPGQQDELVKDLANQAIAFIDQHDLVTVPALCRETWQLDMLDSRTQRVLPFAAYGGQRMLVAYATADMDHERKLESMRGNNPAFTRIVAPHELIPGHHLQAYMAQRYRPWRRAFSTPFYGEGWALHWEMLLWDLKYPRTPEERIGMLVWRSHRAARIIVSLAFHLGEMTPGQMIDFLVENVGLERDGATSEVRRFIGGQYSPLYQAGYMIGGLQIRALYKELVDGAGGGGQMTPRQFHDAVLHQNSIPNAMVRAALLKLPLEGKDAPEWTFYGEVDPADPPATRP